jgi:hypothetical protein
MNEEKKYEEILWTLANIEKAELCEGEKYLQATAIGKNYLPVKRMAHV